MHSRWCLPLALTLVSGSAFAAGPEAPTVLDVALSQPTFHGEPNSLMVRAIVRVDDVANDAFHDATVGYARSSDYVACDASTPWTYSADVQRFDGDDERTWTLYNFVPSVQYRYVVRTGTSGTYRYTCGRLPRVSLPPSLAALNFQYEAAGASHPIETRYVLLNLDDCGEGTSSGAHENIFVLDTENQSIVWYFDLDAMTGLSDATVTGWRYQPATGSEPDRILAIIDRRYLYEWSFDGALRRSHDFAAAGQCDGTSAARGPCVHHDVLTDDRGATYLLTGRISPLSLRDTPWAVCASRFVNDGYRVLDEDFEPIDGHYLMTDSDYDPTVDPGPNVRTVGSATSGSCYSNNWAAYLGGDVVDWTHVNSIDRSTDGTQEVLDLSVRNFDQILRLDADDGSYVWRLASDPDYSDWRPLRMAADIEGARAFSGPHDVHMIGPDTMMMLDNLGDPAASRVLRISLDASSWQPTIDGSWALVDAAGAPLDCPLEGSAQPVPGSGGEHVLAACKDEFTVVELDDSSGYPAGHTIEPPLVISLPDGSSDDFCTSGGPSTRAGLRGFYRAYPLAAVGSFE